ncbi:MAG: hypothetical protein U1D97_13960, partial [Desulfuromonadales bacterium]|nr:hypothetical protein [Desulfuromonadales bacterium]
AAVFSERKNVEELPEAKALKRIALQVGSVTFPGEWWELKRELDRLPEVCRHDLSSELFLNPVCSCGFTIDSTAPEVPADFTASCQAGLRKFLLTLQTTENRERLDSFILSLNDGGQRDLATRCASLINLHAEKVNVALMLPLLTDEVLRAIEKALKGRWTVRELDLADFIGKVKGRRFRHEELKRLFLQWIGDDQDCIIHLRGEEGAATLELKEGFCRYGTQGEAIFRALMAQERGVRSYEELEDRLQEEDGFPALHALRLTAFSERELLTLLKTERLGRLKKQLRGEIFHRLGGKVLSTASLGVMEDRPLAQLLQIAGILAERERYRGVEIFTRVIAPLACRLPALHHENMDESLIDESIITALERNYHDFLAGYEKTPERAAGARDITTLSNSLKGIVAVMDGLRYDLWLILREVMETEGLKLREHPFVMPGPTMTSHFRRLLGIGETEEADGRTALLKWSERGIQTRELKRFLKGDAETKVLHFNFIDSKIHNSTLDLYPLYLTIKSEFIHGIMPILKSLPSFTLLSDHGFIDTGRFKERYTHGGNSIWETILPCVEVE